MTRWLVTFSCGRMLPVEADTEERARIRAYVIERSSAIVVVRRVSTDGAVVEG